MENSTDTVFYNPLCKYNYLTPEQRKRKREIQERKGIRKSEDVQISQSQITKTIKKSKYKGVVKPKLKLKKRKLFGEELIKPILSEMSSTLSEPILNCNSDDKIINKFFKNRSPDHLKKVSKKETSYVLSFIKKSRLNFGDGKHLSTPATLQHLNNVYHNIDDNVSQNLNSNDVNMSKTIDDSTVKVTSVINDVKNKIIYNQKEITQPCSLMGESQDKNRLLMEIQESFMDDSECISKFPNEQPKSRILNGVSSQISNSISPKKDESNSSTSPKLYPVFYKNKERKEESTTMKSPSIKRSFNSKDTSKGSEQMIIDAGQKEFGTKQCKTCNMIYTIGQAEDENLHANYHDKYLVNLKFPGWKNERLIRDYEDGRVIRVLEDDKNFQLKKIKDILCIANRDLGFSTTEFPVRPNVNFFLFISNDKKVRGLLVAESIISASPVILVDNSTVEGMQDGKTVIWNLGSWYASYDSIPAICGINRIWVAKEYRRHKVASRLIDCLRESFIYGYVVSLREIAFTDPTPDGREFAAHYTGTNNFLVYK